MFSDGSGVESPSPSELVSRDSTRETALSNQQTKSQLLVWFQLRLSTCHRNLSRSSSFASWEIGCMVGLFRNYLFYSFTLLAQFEVLFEFVLVVSFSANTANFQESIAHMFLKGTKNVLQCSRLYSFSFKSQKFFIFHLGIQGRPFVIEVAYAYYPTVPERILDGVFHNLPYQ